MARRNYRSTVSDCIGFEELTFEQLQYLYDKVPAMSAPSVNTFLNWVNGNAYWGRSAAEAWFEAVIK